MRPIMYDFECPTHGKFEELCDKNDGENLFADCPDLHFPDPVNRPGSALECNRDSPRVECYAVIGRMKLGEVTQGRNFESDRPAHILDTRALGDGMPKEEWDAKQDKIDTERRHKDVKEMML